MARLKRLIHEVHRRSLWQVLGIYLVGAWIAYEVIQSLTEGLGLPTWFPAFAIVLFIVLLPVVLATAFVQEGVRPAPPPGEPITRPGAEAGGEEDEAADRRAARGPRRVLTWRHATLGLVGALALWGVIAAGWLLVRGGRSGSAEGRTSVAVLPFDNMSAEPENEYFSDGITDDIITQLSKIGELKVISRSSVMQYKNAGKNLRQIGAELDVATILEGGVRRVGNRVRINAQLVDADSDEGLWAETYDRELTDIFAIQSDVALQIAKALEVTLSSEQKERIEREPTENLDAYNAFLLGRFHWNKFTEQDVLKAREYYEQALAFDPSYARAYAGLADVYLVLGGAGLNIEPASVVIPLAKAAAERAIAIDPSIGEAHGSLGLVYLWYEWNWAAAERHMQHGVREDPNSALAHADYAWYLTAVGRHEQAIGEVQRALQLDPLSPLMYENAAWHFYRARRYEEALEYGQRALELDPKFAGAHLVIGSVYLQKEMFEEAIPVLEKARKEAQWPSAIDPAIGYAYGRTGRRAEAMELLQALELLRQQGLASAADLALIPLGLGEHDEALRYLEAAADEGPAASPSLSRLKVDPIFDPLRSDPRFTALLNQMGLEP